MICFVLQIIDEKLLLKRYQKEIMNLKEELNQIKRGTPQEDLISLREEVAAIFVYGMIIDIVEVIFNLNPLLELWKVNVSRLMNNEHIVPIIMDGFGKICFRWRHVRGSYNPVWMKKNKQTNPLYAEFNG